MKSLQKCASVHASLYRRCFGEVSAVYFCNFTPKLPVRNQSEGDTIQQGKPYVNLEDSSIHSNTVEGYFSIFKRGMKGIYQHCGEQHLHRNLAEYEFRYNNRAALGCNDTDRSVAALSGIVGKRLTHKSAGEHAHG
jgi:hypothetical protein